MRLLFLTVASMGLFTGCCCCPCGGGGSSTYNSSFDDDFGTSFEKELAAAVEDALSAKSCCVTESGATFTDAFTCTTGEWKSSTDADCAAVCCERSTASYSFVPAAECTRSAVAGTVVDDANCAGM